MTVKQRISRASFLAKGAVDGVMEDIRRVLARERAQTVGTALALRQAVRDELTRHTGLNDYHDTFSLRLAPHVHTVIESRLGAELQAHPEMLEDATYPRNIMAWIDAYQHDWHEGNFLGCYSTNPHTEGSLYWLSIVLYARRHGWKIQDLVLTVLTHVYAHAFVHRARDTDQCNMSERYDLLLDDVIEGLAQYYTHYTLRDCPDWRAAFNIHRELSKIQPPSYRVHTAWIPAKDFADCSYDGYYRKLPGLKLPPQHDIREIVRQLVVRTLMVRSRVDLETVDTTLSDHVFIEQGEW